MSDAPQRPPRLLMFSLSMLAAAAACTAMFAWSRLHARPSDRADDPGIAGVAPAAAPRSGPPEVQGELPDFTLTAHTGEPISRKDMLGKVWVADFFFIACAQGCPIMNSRMAELQGHLNAEQKSGDAAYADVGLLSITVNPGADDLSALRNYARNYGAGPRWTFATGDRDVIRKIAFEGFKVSSVEDINMHSTRLLLVDRQGRVRGRYAVVPPKGEKAVPDVNNFEKLKADIALLLAEKP